ncbi:hypothetical protein O3M35_003112 [Rhynocoris fuscipes]|uniref:SAM domain-containing protein n=1 Tax=Rhynocoris fuscipes TaxID=488301 RepID=A0AAW1CLC3_9HEMI
MESCMKTRRIATELFNPAFIEKTLVYPSLYRPYQELTKELCDRYKSVKQKIGNIAPGIPIACKLEVITKEFLNDIPLLEPWYWKVEQVGDWVAAIGFPQYRDCFVKNYIDGRVLLRIEAKDLPSINITDFDHIKMITKEIRALYNNFLERKEPKIWEPVMHPYVLYMLKKPYTDLKMTEFFIKWNLVPNTRCEEPHYQSFSHEVARAFTTIKKDKFIFKDNVPVPLQFNATSFLETHNFYW